MTSAATHRVQPTPSAPLVKVEPVKPNRWRSTSNPSVSGCTCPLASTSRTANAAGVAFAMAIAEPLAPLSE